MKMKKRFQSILLVFAMVLSMLPAVTMSVYAATNSGQCGENANYTLDEDGTLRITGSGVVDTPAWEDYKDQIVRVEVTGPSELDSWLFSDHTSIKTVVLGDSVQVVDDYCFLTRDYGTSSLESVQFGSGIRRIGVGAFTGDTYLKQVIIHDLDSWCKVEIDHYSDKSAVNEAKSPLYYGADLILDGQPVTEVVFPEGIERIGAYAFAYCKSLETVTIPASVTSIGIRAFAETPNLSSVTFLGHAPEPDFELFEGHMSYASGIFADPYYSQGQETLYISHPIGDPTYTNRIRDLYTTTYSAKDAPGEDPNEDWPDLFLRDRDSIFSDRVIWPENDPDLIMHGGCGENMMWKLDKAGVLTISGTGEMNIYPYIYKWGEYRDQIEKVVIEDGITSIDSSAFSACWNMTEITIPDSVTIIEGSAFSGCSSLSGISIPDTVTSIGYSAFSFCSALMNVEIPDSVTSIEDRTFFGCDSLTGISIPDTVTSIGRAAFAYCSALMNIEIPDSVTSIEDYTFSGCDSLTGVSIPDTVTSIGNSAFINCSALMSIEIPASVTTIGDKAFGYVYDEEKFDDFVIVGHDATEAQRYAEDNGFTFINLDKPYADYSKVESAIAKTPKDLSGYTEESVKALNDAIAAVKDNMKNTDQPTVDGWAKAIEAAIAGLVEKQVQPELVTIYNSANGADIRWKPDSNKTYVIMRKENGVWKEVKTVEASSLTKEGGNYKYIDEEVKSSYGKGYIYSVAVKDESGKLLYDTKGLAIYRLDKPVITSVATDGKGNFTVSWNKLDAHGYEVQYRKDGENTWSKAPETKDLESEIKGLDAKSEYVFRLRCFKDNADRGRTYSEYSSWAKAGASTAVKPVLVTIYNSANGADIRWKPDSNKTYVIMRKENGVWKEVKTVEASSLTKEGGNYKYIDEDVKSSYGKGYIYSVAAKDSNGKAVYDTVGLPLYRLSVPNITSVKVNANNSITVTWNKVDAHGYEVQYSTDGGKTWVKLEQTTDTKVEVKNLKTGQQYIFRVRCQKTNADRGTTWSQYSNWVSAKV